MATLATAVQPVDSLNPPASPSRVYYSLGRMLGVEDFQADQDYHRGRLARALLQLCGTGTVAGLNVTVPQAWQSNLAYPLSAFVFDTSQNVQVNTGAAGATGNTAPTFGANPGDTVADGVGIVWTNVGQIDTNGWRPNAPFVAPIAIVDSNMNVQVLTAPGTFTTGGISPVWNTAIGGTTLDGNPPAPSWTCAGPSELEVAVSPGLAVDRVGRMIEVPRTVCIRIQAWLNGQSVSDLNNALASAGGSALFIDVFATFAGCTRGVTPCFATQDDYDATDAFSADRLLDSFSMRLILRSDAAPKLPQDPWLATGALPSGALSASPADTIKQNILAAQTGPGSNPPFAGAGVAPPEIPPGLDTSSVFLARISIAATAGSVGQPPAYDLTRITIDNMSRLFLFPAALVARAVGLSSGTQS